MKQITVKYKNNVVTQFRVTKEQGDKLHSLFEDNRALWNYDIEIDDDNSTLAYNPLWGEMAPSGLMFLPFPVIGKTNMVLRNGGYMVMLHPELWGEGYSAEFLYDSYIGWIKYGAMLVTQEFFDFAAEYGFMDNIVSMNDEGYLYLSTKTVSNEVFLNLYNKHINSDDPADERIATRMEQEAVEAWFKYLGGEEFKL